MLFATSGLTTPTPTFAGDNPGVTSSGSIIGLITQGLGLTSQILARTGSGAMNQVPPGAAGLGQMSIPGTGNPQADMAAMARALPGLIAPSGVNFTNVAGYTNRRLFTKSGKPRRMKANGQPWKVPSMNVANVHALRRSMRRVEGFAHVAKRTMSFVHTHKLKKRGKR